MSERKKFTFLARENGYYWWSSVGDDLEEGITVISMRVIDFWVKTPAPLLIEEYLRLINQVKAIDAGEDSVQPWEA